MSPELENLIIKTLSRGAYAELQPRMELVTLTRATVLHQPGQPIQHVYFPRTALVSLVGFTRDGQGTERAMVGHEGFLGVPVVLGTMTHSYEATVQISGTLWRVPKDAVERLHAITVGLTDTLIMVCHCSTGSNRTVLDLQPVSLSESTLGSVATHRSRQGRDR